MNHSIENPYRGPFPYIEGDEYRFFGREYEVRQLIDLIKKNQLTVFYGASGTGKTSLIKARLLPQLRREYFHPIYIRINFANENEDPLLYVQSQICEELRTWEKELPNFEAGQSLVDYASKNVIFKGLVQPVLFFDQFEELFSLGPKLKYAKIQKFIFELSQLIELRLPDDLKTTVAITNITSFKVVFSLRQDWVGYLDDFSQIIPSVNECRYRLKKFTPEQAIAAIRGSSTDENDSKTALTIIKAIGTPALWRQNQSEKIKAGKDLLNLEVDPFVLSLYCYQLHVISSEQGNTKITNELALQYGGSQLIRQYYETNIHGYEEIARLVEDHLLNDAGKRLTIDISKFSGNDLTTEQKTREFENKTGIVRIFGPERNCEIEIVHDRLASQIFESRTERRVKSKQDEANKLEMEAEKLKNSAERAKKTTYKLGIFASVVIIALLTYAIYIYINFKDDHTLLGLQQQLNSSNILIDKNFDSINSLNAKLIQLRQIPTVTDNASLNSSSKDWQKLYEKLVISTNVQADSLRKVNELLKISINEKTKSIVDLQVTTNLLRDRIALLELKSPGIQTPATSENKIKKFEKNDLLDARLINQTTQTGALDIDDIKTRGFIFVTVISPENFEENGKIEIRVNYKIGKNSYSYETDFRTIKAMQADIQAQNWVIKVPKEDSKKIKAGKGWFEVRYFVSRENTTNYTLLSKQDFIIEQIYSYNN